VFRNPTVPCLFMINKTNENPIEKSDAYLNHTTVSRRERYAFDRSVEGYRARPLHLLVCQGGTAMGSSFGTSDSVYSKSSFYVSFRSTILYFGCSAMRTRMCQDGVSDTCPSSIGEASHAVHALRSVSASGGSGSHETRRVCHR